MRSVRVQANRCLNKPHYVFRPRQILRRARYVRRTWSIDQTTIMTLPWGVPIECWPADTIGSSIGRAGLYDLVVTESLFRLADEGDVVVDAGANIGHMSSVLACAVGRSGRVISIEPQPLVYDLLERNARRWRQRAGMSRVETHRAGLSDRCGVGCVVTRGDFSRNRGTSEVHVGDGSRHGGDPVALVRLDELARSSISVLKLDVEGHELAALKGSKAHLSRGEIRDVLFEEHAGYPTPVTDYLEGHGYEVFCVAQGWTGPRLLPADVHGAGPLWDPPLLVATRDARRLRLRLRPRWWRALR